MATIKEKYNTLRKAAKQYAADVDGRKSYGAGFWASPDDINGSLLKQEVVTAYLLGYESHLRIVNGNLHIYHVAKMPGTPYEISYAPTV